MRMPVAPLKQDPGAAPGIEHDELAALLPENAGPARVTCVDFSPSEVAMQEISDLADFLAHHRPAWSAVRWINVDGLGDLAAVHALAAKYDLHPLAIEDMLHTSHRPKIEAYGGEDSGVQARLFIVARVPALVEGRLRHSQVSIFLGHKTVLTFQQSPTDAWQPIYQRLKTKGSRLRSADASFLAYSLLDSVVDRCFPILESFSEQAEALEESILAKVRRAAINDIHQFKRELLLLRWIIWPMREVVSTLLRDEHECLGEQTRVYLRDLHDHVIQIVEILETYREMASDLTETYMTLISNRMNDVIKVLTLIGTIFIPLTFLADVYGLNFHYLPHLDRPWLYPVFWLVCFTLAGSMLWYFRRRLWL